MDGSTGKNLLRTLDEIKIGIRSNSEDVVRENLTKLLNELEKNQDLLFTFLDMDLEPCLTELVDPRFRADTRSFALDALSQLVRRRQFKGTLEVTAAQITALINCLSTEQLGDIAADALWRIIRAEVKLQALVKSSGITDVVLNLLTSETTLSDQKCKMIAAIYPRPDPSFTRRVETLKPEVRAACLTSWVVCDLFESKDHGVSLQQMLLCLRSLRPAFATKVVVKVKKSACKALALILEDGCPSLTEAVINHGYVMPLFRMLENSKYDAKPSALSCIGSIARSGLKQNESIFESGCMDKILALVSSEYPLDIQRKALQTYSDIIASSAEPYQGIERSMEILRRKDSAVDEQSSCLEVIFAVLESDGVGVISRFLEKTRLEPCVPALVSVLQESQRWDSRRLRGFLRGLLLLLSELEMRRGQQSTLEVFLNCPALAQVLRRQRDHPDEGVALYVEALQDFDWIDAKSAG